MKTFKNNLIKEHNFFNAWVNTNQKKLGEFYALYVEEEIVAGNISQAMEYDVFCAKFYIEFPFVVNDHFLGVPIMCN
jgi:hypothetical protein